MKGLTGICLAFVVIIGSLTVSVPPANAWFWFLVRGAAGIVIKEEYQERKAKCKAQPKACRPKTQKLSRGKSLSKPRLKGNKKTNNRSYQPPLLRADRANPR